jgi:1,4-dihydroxy-2-naphthoate polyprenyltransferase
LIAFIRLGRPHFLAGGVMMNALGVSAALYAGASLNWLALVLGQVAITATQWMVHYANDYFDLPADRLNASSTVWSGGSRVLPRGALPPRLAYRAAIALALIAVLAAVAIALFAAGGPLAPLLIGLALFLSWGYSAPPFRFLSRGFGELLTASVVAVLTPSLGFYLQAGYLPNWLFAALWAVFCLQLCFQLCVNFPDAASDAAAGKRTLVVRRPAAASVLYMTSLVAAYLAIPLMLLASLPASVAAVLLFPAPIAAWLLWRAGRGSLTDPQCWVANEWANVILVFLTAAIEAAAFVLVRG